MADEEPLLAPTFLFRFSIPCRKVDPLWSEKQIQLPETHRLPTFGELEDRPVFADVRLGWSVEGLAVSLSVFGKKQSPWCRGSRIEDSDGLSLWIDTRNTQNIHRASRFCHHFVLMPQGGGRRMEDPLGQLVDIYRARENPKEIDSTCIQMKSEKRIDGYLLRAAIPAAALTGFDPEEQTEIGFTYAVFDRELGCQSFTISNEFPIESDPSLWGSLQLVNR